MMSFEQSIFLLCYSALHHFALDPDLQGWPPARLIGPPHRRCLSAAHHTTPHRPNLAPQARIAGTKATGLDFGASFIRSLPQLPLYLRSAAPSTTEGHIVTSFVLAFPCPHVCSLNASRTRPTPNRYSAGHRPLWLGVPFFIFALSFFHRRSSPKRRAFMLHCPLWLPLYPRSQAHVPSCATPAYLVPATS
jgi:hypothetical protein